MGNIKVENGERLDVEFGTGARRFTGKAGIQPIEGGRYRIAVRKRLTGAINDGVVDGQPVKVHSVAIDGDLSIILAEPVEEATQ